MLSRERLPTTRSASIEFYRRFLGAAAQKSEFHVTQAKRWLARNDLFYLLTAICKRKDINRDWLFDRCREVERDPNGRLDLWAREHYKSTIITFGLSLQDILASHGDDPEARYGGREVTIGILSFNRPTAKAFLRQIKFEVEQNEDLKALFPDVLWGNPHYDAPKWSEDDGLIFRRKANPKEATVEAHGLVDGMPTGKHYMVRVYDDVVTKESVGTPEMILKTTDAWALSDNLGTEGGWARTVGTRYHLFDTYATMIERGAALPRVHACTSDGSEDFSKAVLMTPDTLIKKRKAQGPYVFGCFPAGSPVLMADWTEKGVEHLAVGDEVVGYDFPVGSKSRLVKATVLAIQSRRMAVIEATFASGRTVRCTPEHKWYTGRRGADVGGSDNHSAYLPLGFEKQNLKSLISVYDPRRVNGACDERAAAWLGGFFDGEGAVSGGQIHMHQTDGRNRVVCERLEATLQTLGFDFGMTQRIHSKAGWQAGRDYYIRGGREEHIRFLRQCRPARAHKIVDGLYARGSRKFGKACRDALVSIEAVGEQQVFNVETTTGNYICYGYATKNSQMLLNPIADKLQGFKDEWLQYWPASKANNLNIYILVDPASKKKKASDYTVMWVIGVGGDGNYYVLDVVRDRLNLTERQKMLFALHRKWRPIRVGYEEYGLQADIEHHQYVMKERNYRFEIVPLGGSMAKEDRIKRLVPKCESRMVYLPEGGLVRTNHEGQAVDLIRVFREEEYLAFPVCAHDDMLDAMSRILDEEMQVSFPMPEPAEDTPKWMQDIEAELQGGTWETA